MKGKERKINITDEEYIDMKNDVWMLYWPLNKYTWKLNKCKERKDALI
jgi:hypothetical protein